MMLGARQFFERRGAPTPPLPYDAEVEYLESTGTQYIDTGRPIPSDFWFDATIDVTGTTTAYKTLLGARIVSGSFDYQFSFYNTGNMFLARYGITTSQYYSSLQTGMTRIRVESGGKLYINESFVKQLGVGSPSDRLNMYIFALNENGAVSQGAEYIRLYSLKYGGTNEVRDFIPVRFTNELGQSEGAMYDRVSGQLFRNAGTGAFIYGGDKISVETDRYVHDGLIAMWDGKENAGVGVHDQNATTWKDLSGHGYDLSCFNSYEWLDSAVKLSGGSRPIYRPSTIIGEMGADAHVSIVAEAESNGGVILGLGQGPNNSAIVFTRRSDGAFVQIANSAGAGIKNVVPFTESLFSIAVNYSGGDIAYSEVNGIQKDQYYTFGGTFCSTVCVGDRANDSSVPFTGKVHAIRIYNRTLTSAEIAANYAIDKARFNLP